MLKTKHLFIFMDRSLLPENILIPWFCPNDKHCLVLFCFMPLCFNTMHTVVECISTLISEDDTYFFTDFKRKFQKKNVLTEKNSV